MKLGESGGTCDQLLLPSWLESPEVEIGVEVCVTIRCAVEDGKEFGNPNGGWVNVTAELASESWICKMVYL